MITHPLPEPDPDEDLPAFVITFNRTGIRDGWVEVLAVDEQIARAWARKEYGAAWAGIYDRDEFLSQNKATLALFTQGRFGEPITLSYKSVDHV